MELDSRVAVATGAGSGIGARVAVALARRGAAVVVNGRRPHKLAETVAEIEGLGGTATACPGDASEPDVCARMVEAARVHGRLAAIPEMLAGGRGGAIVNVSSVYGLVALKYAGAYSAAKGGLVQLTRSAAIDYAEHDIRVNCVCPDLVEPVERAETPPEARAMLVSAWLGSPTGRATCTDDLAELIAFLAGPHAVNITGAVIPVGGGYSAR